MRQIGTGEAALGRLLAALRRWPEPDSFHFSCGVEFSYVDYRCVVGNGKLVSETEYLSSGQEKSVVFRFSCRPNRKSDFNDSCSVRFVLSFYF
jgi:hypothetical protein